CGGRILRGEGIKYIGHPKLPFKSATHINNIILKKELYSEIFLDQAPIQPEGLNLFAKKILETSIAMVGAQRDHCEPSKEWTNFLESLVGQILAELPEEEMLWEEYEKLKEITLKKDEVPEEMVIEEEKDEVPEEMVIEENKPTNQKRKIDIFS